MYKARYFNNNKIGVSFTGHNSIFKEHIQLINLVRSVITGKSQAEVWDFPVMTNYGLFSTINIEHQM